MWYLHESVYIYLPKEQSVSISGIAGFDFDATLVRSKSGRQFIKDEHDWIITYDSVITILQELKNKGYTIVIMSNQLKFNDRLKLIFDSFLTYLNYHNLDPYLLIATDKDQYRKPNIGMLSLFLMLTNTDLTMVNEYSFYCGDAAGKTHTNLAYQWSDSDQLFATNCHLKFYTPDQLFPSFQQPEPSTKQEMIINVGNQGSGKSSYSDKFQSIGYKICCQDILKTKAKVKSHVIEAIKAGYSVIIDSTNPSKKSRAEWIEIANNYNLPVRIFWFTCNGRIYNQLRSKPVPEIAYNQYSSKFEQPTENEGVSVIRIN